MKLIRSAALLLLLTVSFVACKKDSEPKSAGSFEGTWKGKFGFGNDEPEGFIGFNIKSGGLFQEIGASSGNPIGEGTWTMAGTTLKATYKMLFSPFNEYSVSINVDQAGLMTGTWGYDKSATDGGKVKLNKIN
jgi:hypothetical protein